MSNYRNALLLLSVVIVIFLNACAAPLMIGAGGAATQTSFVKTKYTDFRNKFEKEYIICNASSTSCDFHNDDGIEFILNSTKEGVSLTYFDRKFNSNPKNHDLKMEVVEHFTYEQLSEKKEKNGLPVKIRVFGAKFLVMQYPEKIEIVVAENPEQKTTLWSSRAVRFEILD